MKTAEKYLKPRKLALETLTEEQYEKYLNKTLPLHVSETCEHFAIEDKRDYLGVFFQEQDLRNEIVKKQPLLAYDTNSPKQQQFQAFDSRIQVKFGSNKSGKSGGGSYKIDKIALGKLDSFPYKPAPGQTIYGWVCSETRAMIEDTPLKQIKKWLREDQYEEKRGNGGKIEKIIITADNGGKCEIELKPYEGGVKTFESSNIHFIWCDEPPSQPIFEAMWARLVEFSGWLIVTGTTVQPDSKYLREMISGDGPLGHFSKFVDIQWIELTIWDNKTLTKQQIDEFVALYKPGTPMYKIRVLGQYSDLEGLVFPSFITEHTAEEGRKIYWHAHPRDYINEERKRHCVRIDGLDYGTDKPFALCNFYFEKNEGPDFETGKPTVDYTLRLEDEIYEGGTHDRQQAGYITERTKKHGIPVVNVADRQISGNPKDGKTTLHIYQEVIPPKYWPKWHMKEKDKRNPLQGLSKINDWFNRVNRVTGKPCFTINEMCINAIKEFNGLLYKSAAQISTARDGITKGPDHIVDLTRYIFSSGFLDNGMLYIKYGKDHSVVKEVLPYY